MNKPIFTYPTRKYDDPSVACARKYDKCKGRTAKTTSSRKERTLFADRVVRLLNSGYATFFFGCALRTVRRCAQFIFSEPPPNLRTFSVGKLVGPGLDKHPRQKLRTRRRFRWKPELYLTSVERLADDVGGLHLSSKGKKQGKTSVNDLRRGIKAKRLTSTDGLRNWKTIAVVVR